MDKVRTKLKSTWLIRLPENTNVFCDDIEFITQNKKLKTKDTETGEKKIQEDLVSQKNR